MYSSRVVFSTIPLKLLSRNFFTAIFNLVQPEVAPFDLSIPKILVQSTTWSRSDDRSRIWPFKVCQSV